VVDAIGGTSLEAHPAGLERVMQAGGQPVRRIPSACGLRRDRAREETAASITEIVLNGRFFKEPAPA